MRKKNSNSLATKQDLQATHRELKDEIGKLGKDVNILRTDVSNLRATVGGFRSDVDGLRDDVDNLSEQVKGLPTKNEFYSKMDEVVGELKTIREEQEAHSGSHDRIQETIDEHEEKIAVLEQKSL